MQRGPQNLSFLFGELQLATTPTAGETDNEGYSALNALAADTRPFNDAPVQALLDAATRQSAVTLAAERTQAAATFYNQVKDLLKSAGYQENQDPSLGANMQALYTLIQNENGLYKRFVQQVANNLNALWNDNNIEGLKQFVENNKLSIKSDNFIDGFEELTKQCHQKGLPTVELEKIRLTALKQARKEALNSFAAELSQLGAYSDDPRYYFNETKIASQLANDYLPRLYKDLNDTLAHEQAVKIERIYDKKIKLLEKEASERFKLSLKELEAIKDDIDLYFLSPSILKMSQHSDLSKYVSDGLMKSNLCVDEHLFWEHLKKIDKSDDFTYLRSIGIDLQILDKLNLAEKLYYIKIKAAARFEQIKAEQATSKDSSQDKGKEKEKEKAASGKQEKKKKTNDPAAKKLAEEKALLINLMAFKDKFIPKNIAILSPTSLKNKIKRDDLILLNLINDDDYYELDAMSKLALVHQKAITARLNRENEILHTLKDAEIFTMAGELASKAPHPRLARLMMAYDYPAIRQYLVTHDDTMNRLRKLSDIKASFQAKTTISTLAQLQALANGIIAEKRQIDDARTKNLIPSCLSFLPVTKTTQQSVEHICYVAISGNIGKDFQDKLKEHTEKTPTIEIDGKTYRYQYLPPAEASWHLVLAQISKGASGSPRPLSSIDDPNNVLLPNFEKACAEKAIFKQLISDYRQPGVHMKIEGCVNISLPTQSPAKKQELDNKPIECCDSCQKQKAPVMLFLYDQCRDAHRLASASDSVATPISSTPAVTARA